MDHNEQKINLYIHTIILIALMSLMDVFNFKVDWGMTKSGWDYWHLTKWILIAYLIADKMNWKKPDKYKNAGLIFMWLTLIVVGLHHFILHILF